MPVSVDVSLGRQSKVELAKAVLLYQESRHQGDAFATVHEVTGVEEGPACARARSAPHCRGAEGDPQSALPGAAARGVAAACARRES